MANVQMGSPACAFSTTDFMSSVWVMPLMPDSLLRRVRTSWVV